jgi:hypothetical protein
LFNERKQNEWQWLQNSRRANRDILNNVKCEVNRHFRKEKKPEHLKEKFKELETNRT